MIQTYTRLNVADNSGAKRIRLINIPGASKRKYAKVGDIIVCNVREAVPNSMGCTSATCRRWRISIGFIENRCAV